MPAFNYGRAAAAIVDAHRYGDRRAAKLHGVTVRSLRRWRRRLMADRYLRALVDSMERNGLELEPDTELLITDHIKTSRKHNAPTSVYLIRAANNLIKIGIAKDVSQRLQQLDTMSPLPLDLIATLDTTSARRLERKLHERFAHKRVRGEWFGLSDEDIAWVLMFYDNAMVE